jgi:hypothetical protein
MQGDWQTWPAQAWLGNSGVYLQPQDLAWINAFYRIGAVNPLGTFLQVQISFSIGVVNLPGGTTGGYDVNITLPFPVLPTTPGLSAFSLGYLTMYYNGQVSALSYGDTVVAVDTGTDITIGAQNFHTGDVITLIGGIHVSA